MNPIGALYLGETEDDMVELRPPDFSIHLLPLIERVSFYFREIGADTWSIQHLVYLKTLRESNGLQSTADCDYAKQMDIKDELTQRFLLGTRSVDTWKPWKSDAFAKGQYVASGMLRQRDFDLSFGITDEEAEAIERGNVELGFPAIPFPKNHPARMQVGPIYDGARDRFLQNRERFRRRADIKRIEAEEAKAEEEEDTEEEAESEEAAELDEDAEFDTELESDDFDEVGVE